MFVKIKRDGWKERVIQCTNYSLDKQRDPNGGKDFIIVECDPGTDRAAAYTFDVGTGQVFVMNDKGDTIDRYPKR